MTVFCEAFLTGGAKGNRKPSIGQVKSCGKATLTKSKLSQIIDLKWNLSFISHEWPRQNFSSQFQYNIMQSSGENE